MIHNCLTNPEDSVRAHHLYVTAIPLLQGFMKCHRNPAETFPRILLPTDIFLHHKNIELYFDFYLTGMPFLHTKSSNITFLTAEHFISNNAENIIKELQTVTNIYK